MIKAALVACLLASCLTWSIIKESEKALKPVLNTHEGHNLKFGSFIGPGVTQSLSNAFIKAANDAYSVWGGNVTGNLKYISNYINSYGGNPGDEFFVFMQATTVVFGWSVWSYGSVVATYTGIVPAQPGWSYMFLKGNINTPSPSYSIVEGEGVGDGVDKDTETFIRNLLKSEDDGSCNVNNIESKVLNYDQQLWSVICDDSKDVHAIAEPTDAQWIYAQGNNNWFLLWVIG